MVQESSLVLKETPPSKGMQEAIDELEETISLRDLPLYGVDEGEVDSSSISSSKRHSHFEFFSQELNPNPSSTTSQPENIIFCGKLIPYKKPDSPTKHISKPVESRKQTKNQDRDVSIPSQNSNRRNHTNKRYNTSTGSSMHEHGLEKGKRGHDSPMQKMSILTSSPSGKAKWYWLLFGSSGLSPKVDLRRQSRRLYPTSSPSPPSSPLFRYENGNVKSNHGGGRKQGCGMWGLIRALSCGTSQYPESMVAASISSIRRV